MEELVRITEENMSMKFILSQIRDYLMENVSADDCPSYFVCGEGKGEAYLGIRNAVAMLMEEADDSLKRRIREEME
jgi:hypothetical protein